MGIAIAGLCADARSLAKYMQTECLNHKFAYDTPLPTGNQLTHITFFRSRRLLNTNIFCLSHPLYFYVQLSTKVVSSKMWQTNTKTVPKHMCVDLMVLVFSLQDMTRKQALIFMKLHPRATILNTRFF